ncbi:MAG: hypothetical protein N2512_00350 [Armatimonadetes bacterium]|nr:hypothetical protein [Armatimonadota bacterium]
MHGRVDYSLAQRMTPMTMLELLNSLVELLHCLRLEGRGPVPVEKYRRLEPASGPRVYVTPLSQREQAEAIGGQYVERLEVEVRCEVPWQHASVADADALLALIDKALVLLEANREIGQAKRGRIGEVRYGLRHRRTAQPALYGRFTVEFTADKA